jgi:hypothetical protein
MRKRRWEETKSFEKEVVRRRSNSGYRKIDEQAEM